VDYLASFLQVLPVDVMVAIDSLVGLVAVATLKVAAR
jgi:hypothetical protein